MKKLMMVLALVVGMFGTPILFACSHGAPPTPPPQNNDFGA